MSGANPEAAFWAQAAFDSSMIGIRGALERALLDLRGISRTGGDVARARADLAALLRETVDRAATVPDAPGAPKPFSPEGRPTGMPAPWTSGDALPWGVA